MQDLRQALGECRKRLAKHKKSGQKIGEQNTKAMLIEPVLEALGWDLFDPDEVDREYRRRSTDNPVDYALLLMRTPRLFVEAKGLGENINDPKWANQVLGYAVAAGVEWVALTDGAEWRIYNAHAPVPAEEKLFRSVKIDTDGSETRETLALLSTENMKKNRIQDLWRGYFIDRQVSLVLTDLFAGTEPPADLINMVTKRAERVTNADVRASLVRVRASFDWPTPEATPPPAYARGADPDMGSSASSAPQPPNSGARARGAARSGSRKVTRPETRLQLTDLLHSGRLLPGEITAEYDGQDWTAHIDQHGAVVFKGESGLSLSGAGKRVKLASRGPETPETTLTTAGWAFWSARDHISGDLVTLGEIRRRTAQDQGLIDM